MSRSNVTALCGFRCRILFVVWDSLLSFRYDWFSPVREMLVVAAIWAASAATANLVFPTSTPPRIRSKTSEGVGLIPCKSLCSLHERWWWLSLISFIHYKFNHDFFSFFFLICFSCNLLVSSHLRHMSPDSPWRVWWVIITAACTSYISCSHA